jgi:hypothetical protein
MPALADVGLTRRRFLKQTLAGSLGLFALDLLAHEQALAALSPSPGAVFADKTAENLVKLALKVNGVTKKLRSIRVSCCSTRCASGSDSPDRRKVATRVNAAPAL